MCSFDTRYKAGLVLRGLQLRNYIAAHSMSNESDIESSWLVAGVCFSKPLLPFLHPVDQHLFDWLFLTSFGSRPKSSGSVIRR